MTCMYPPPQVFVNDLTQLGENETLGNTSDNNIKEYSSPFTDIEYSKNKIITAIDWMPDARSLLHYTQVSFTM